MENKEGTEYTPVPNYVARDIETRYLNYPKQRTYKKDDLEKIIYGKR